MYVVSNKIAKLNLDSALLWHCLLGYISKKRIEKLQHDGLLNSTDLRAFEKCVSCMSEKMARKPYTHQVERAKDLLGLIHTDVCGSFRTMSRQGASYFVTVTDDFSRYGYVYLLKHKHEVFETFNVFQKKVENQLGKTIKSLCSDRGGEYMSQKFFDHLKEHEIIAHRTPPFTPQHNGVSERRNRTLLDMTDTTVIPTEIPITTPTIPPPPDYTPASPDYSHASEPESDPSEDPLSDHIPSLPATLPFLSSTNDTTNSDTPNTPPLPTHGMPFTEITYSTQRSPVIPRRRVMILAPGQPILHGRPYRYHPNGPVHMMTARKRVGLIPVQQLAVRHFVDHSSSDYFSLDDSARDSSSDSSSKASSDFHSDASFDSSSKHSLLDHSSPVLPSTSAGPSCKRRRSPMTFVPALPPISGALSPVRADLVPLPKRVLDSGYLADVERFRQRLTSVSLMRMLLGIGVYARVVIEAVDREESETGARGPVEVKVDRVTHPVVADDIPEPAQEGAVEVTYETLGDLVQRFHDHTEAILVYCIQVVEGVQREQGHRIVGVESAVTALTERIAKLEKDNGRLRGTASVESQRVDRLQCGMSRMQRELRQIRRLRFYDRVIAISVLSDSSEDSVGTNARRVILFGTIPTTIPDTTPVITPPTT
ncbi:putative reverse transcriptase domain-containing protein [Tanacetum coccineum]